MTLLPQFGIADLIDLLTRIDPQLAEEQAEADALREASDGSTLLKEGKIDPVFRPTKLEELTSGWFRRR